MEKEMVHGKEYYPGFDEIWFEGEFLNGKKKWFWKRILSNRRN